MAKRKEHNGASERTRHAAWAGLIALVLALSTLLGPFDQLNWITQARIANFQASGDIVYIGSGEDLTDPAVPKHRIELAQTLDRLREAGVDRVYLDMAFDAPSTAAADTQLNQALRAFDGDAYIVQNFASGINGEEQLAETTEQVGAGVPFVSSHRWQNYLGYAWDMRYSVSSEGVNLPTLPASIAGIDRASGLFPINYGFNMASIPSFRFRDLVDTPGPLGSQAELPADLANKVVVVGTLNRSDTNSPNIPGHIEVPASMVDIYAAETLKAGYNQLTESEMVALVMLGLLCLICQIGNGPLRYSGYGLLVASLPMAIYSTAKIGMLISITAALTLVAAYGVLRVRSKWRNNLRKVDPATGLPTFAALEADKVVAETVPAIIVARIHRFEEVRKTLPADLHAEYVLRIVSRLKAAKQDAPIYMGPSHSIAWTFPEKEPALIREHLEGLRALFSSPLLVGDNQVDVGITFGVDITPSPNVSQRLAAAMDAAESTTETYEPIAIAELASDEDLIWNISLQARIDNALSNGEIYTIYQPKVLVQTGELVGVEALVRWRDPVKGLIPPDHFIRQCENTGRMSHLTRHVLTQACNAGNDFADHGMPLSVAVNI